LALFIFFPFFGRAFFFDSLAAFTFTGFRARNCSRNARCLSFSAFEIFGVFVFFHASARTIEISIPSMLTSMKL